ncbi:MAG TPA: NAD(P)/FAD-dependent oxidoreductase [Steroidobacteraceae bacterium]|nr:NAD(P)/FAD-dependent oxidoreductase [Steroidobacteraceae bacterium]
MADQVDCVVIGAGVVGLAVARALALAGREVLLLEAENHAGTITSARNSGVIHAGLYYAPGSFKARFCVAGNRAMYDYCAARGVDHHNCGKLIIANGAEEEQVLQRLLNTAQRNEVPGVRLISSAEAHKLEPEVRCTAALLCSSSGIVDQHPYMLALQGDLENAGGTLVSDCRVDSLTRSGGGFLVKTGGASATEVQARFVVNSAGLGAVDLLNRIDGYPKERIPVLHLARGNYFTVAARSPFKHLIYPVPQTAGLGIHATLDLGKRVRFGPDVEWIDKIDYSVDTARAPVFYEAIRRYWPGLADGALMPDYTGIRPKLHGPGEPQPDFRIESPADHGLAGLVNLLGIESPGLTSSLPIGDYVASFARLP